MCLAYERATKKKKTITRLSPGQAFAMTPAFRLGQALCDNGIMMNGVHQGFKNHTTVSLFLPVERFPFRKAAPSYCWTKSSYHRCVESASALSQEACPAWAYQAAMNLTACKILTPAATLAPEKTLTRADAAEMLVAALRVTEARRSGHSLLSWLN
jgi:hypothetical protein